MRDHRNPDTKAIAASLPCWSGPVEPRLMKGGLTNMNYLVEDAGQRYVVRVGGDIPIHQILRSSDHAASRAAHAAGISPEVIHADAQAMVVRYIDSRPLAPEDIRNPETLFRIVGLLKSCHQDVSGHLRGPVQMFWVFHVIRNYVRALQSGGSRYVPLLPDLLRMAAVLEPRVQPIEMVFSHNDLLGNNILNDGNKLWLIDWEYAGFNSPLFDLACLATANELDNAAEEVMLEHYYQREIDADLRRRYHAMKAASLLREAFWSMVDEQFLKTDVNNSEYTKYYLQRFEKAYEVIINEYTV